MDNNKPSFEHRYSSANISLSLIKSSLAITSLLVSSSLFAADNLADKYKLGTIVVTPNAEIGSQYQINQEDMERINARSLDDALKFVPSLNVRNGADGTPRLDIRGLRTRQIKLLVNGVPYNSTFDGQFDPTLIPTFMIDRINLEAGGSSVLYGDGGMGGVLDIHTRSGFDGFKTGAKAEVGTDHFWHTNAYASYGDGQNDLFLAGGVRARNAFPMSSDFNSVIAPTKENYQDDDKRNNSDYRRENFLLTYNRQLTEALTAGVFISHLQGNYGKPPITLDNSVDDFANKAKYDQTKDQNGTTVQVGGDYSFNDNWAGKLWLFSNQQDEDLYSYDNADYNTIVKKNSYEQYDETHIRGFHAQVDGMMNNSSTKIGFTVDHRREDYQSDGRTCNKNTCTKASDYAAIDVDKAIDIDSYAVELNQALAYDMTLIVGAAQHELNKDGGNDDSEQSARVVLSKALNESTSVYASLARKVDAPTIRQLYDANGGNDSLGFQRANHKELGLNKHWAQADLKVALYHSRVFDFIEKDSTDTYMNRQKLVFEGVDVNGELRPTDKFTLRSGLGVLKAKDESSDAATSTLQYRPHYKFSLDADYQLAQNWSVAGNLVHISKQAYFNRTDDADHRNLDSFTLVGSKLSYALPSQAGQVYVGVDNLFDEDYETSYGFPQAGRFFYTGINLSWQ